MSRLRAWLLWFDANYVRNHFCHHCDRQTFRQHNHHMIWPGEHS
jgi:hypothetical protein